MRNSGERSKTHKWYGDRTSAKDWRSGESNLWPLVIILGGGAGKSLSDSVNTLMLLVAISGIVFCALSKIIVNTHRFFEIINRFV